MKMKLGSRFLLLLGIFLALLILFVADQVGRMKNASNSRELPLIAIVFDDAHNSFPIAVEKMRNLGIEGSMYVPTGPIGAQPNWHTNWDEIERAYRIGWEIGSHTVTHPDLTTIDIEKARKEISESLEHLRAHGIEAKSFAAPYGKLNSQVESVIMGHFSNNRRSSQEEGPNTITPENLNVRALPFVNASSSQELRFAQDTVLAKVVASSEFAIIVFHKIAFESELPVKSAEVIDEYTVTEEDFDNFLEAVSRFERAGRLKTVTVSEGVSELQWRKSAWKGIYQWIAGQ